MFIMIFIDSVTLLDIEFNLDASFATDDAIAKSVFNIHRHTVNEDLIFVKLFPTYVGSD